MADIDFVIWLSDKDWILVIIKTLKNKVLSYIVKYNALINDKEYEIARFDSGHDNIHIDILLPDGSKERVVVFNYVIQKEYVVDFALSHFRASFEIYRERFEKWLSEKK